MTSFMDGSSDIDALEFDKHVGLPRQHSKMDPSWAQLGPILECCLGIYLANSSITVVTYPNRALILTGIKKD